MILSYFNIFLFLCVGILVGCLPLLLGFLLSSRTLEDAKLSPYECGFEPFDDARSLFNIRFYVIAILFVIFDLEVVFLFPWAVVSCFINREAFFYLLFFLFILTFGFFYEWKKGALEWK